MHIYDKFEYLCKLKGVTEATAYKEMGINKGTISLWRTARDNNEHVTPSTKNAVKLSKYFGYPTDYFLQGNQLTLDQIEEQKNKPALPQENELTETRLKLWNLINNMDEQRAKDIEFVAQMDERTFDAFIAAAKALLKQA